MKIIQLVEQSVRLYSSEDLGNAFSDQEWLNIAAHFLKQKYSGITDSQIMGGYRRFQRDVGNKMPTDMTPEQWNGKAVWYNMEAGVDNWVGIYDHLEPYSTIQSSINARDISPVERRVSLSSATPESRTEIGNWVQTEKTEWSADEFNDFREEFWKPWFRKLRTERESLKDNNGNSWWDIVFSRTYPGSGGERVNVPRRQAIDELYTSLQNKETIILKDVIDELWVWLRGTDTVFQNRVTRQGNRSVTD